MVHTQVSDEYINSALMYTTDCIFHVLQIKHLVNLNGETTTPHKLEFFTKYLVSKIISLFCPYVVRKATAKVDTKTVNMRHKSQKGF